MALAGELRARVVDQNNRPVEDAVVVAKSQSATSAAPAKPGDEVVTQLDKEFVPHVKPVLVGSRVHFPNKDTVQHEVYSFSPAKKFQLPLYSGTSAPPVLFDKTGVVALGCNIHDWMIGYIYVADTPHTGKTAKEGTVLIKDLPPGEYQVRVWQPNMSEAEDATVKRVTVGAGATDVEWRITLKPPFKVRRAPAAGRGGYR
jgi:plastocyanin